MIIRPYFKILKIVDGDGVVVENFFNKENIEIRFYGIDAPEIKKCRKLLNDELETHLAGDFLIYLGLKSLNFLRSIVPIGTLCTILQEPSNQTDIYGRTLAYLILPNGDEVNKIMIENGYAKPYNKSYCEKLPQYQELNLIAKQNKSGLYAFSDYF